MRIVGGPYQEYARSCSLEACREAECCGRFPCMIASDPEHYDRVMAEREAQQHMEFEAS